MTGVPLKATQLSDCQCLANGLVPDIPQGEESVVNQEHDSILHSHRE